LENTVINRLFVQLLNFSNNQLSSFQELIKLQLRQRVDRHVLQVGQASKLSHGPGRRTRTDVKVVNKKSKFRKTLNQKKTFFSAAHSNPEHLN